MSILAFQHVSKSYDQKSIALEDIFYNGADIAAALQTAEDTCNQELEGSGFVSAEPQYKYAAEAK
jgi:hypothetical protein